MSELFHPNTYKVASGFDLTLLALVPDEVRPLRGIGNFCILRSAVLSQAGWKIELFRNNNMQPEDKVAEFSL